MKRDIVTTIEFSQGFLSINVLEKLSNNQVEIFAACDHIHKAHSFLKESLEQIENLISGKLKEVVVVVDPSQRVETSIELVKDSLTIPNKTISQKDINFLLESIKRKNIKPEKEITLIQPVQFNTISFQDDVKSYSKVPLNRECKELEIIATLTYIDKPTFDFVQQIVKSHKLNISQILTKPQTISQNNLSENALVSGAVLIHIDEKQSFISLNKNNATVASLSIYDFGFEKLIKGVQRIFECTFEDAHKLVSIYGSLENDTENVIYTKHEGFREKRYTVKNLTEIIKMFYKKLLITSNNFITQRGVENLPIVISGKLSIVDGIENYSLSVLEKRVSVYRPMTFVEMNDQNHNTLGFIKWTYALDGTLGKKFDTIVETNPNPFIYNTKRIKLFRSVRAKFAQLLGGKNDWNN